MLKSCSATPRVRSGCRALLGGAVVATSLVAGPAPIARAQGSASAVAITHVTVIDVTNGRRLPAHTVIVEGNRIASVEPDGRARMRAGTTVVDGTGKFLIPGLWDMHVHATGPMLDRLFLPVLVAHGVTGVREMWGRFAWFDSARAQGARGAFAVPRIVGSGHILDGAPAIWPGSLGAQSADDVRRLVDSLARGGAAFIKVYSRLTPEQFRTAAAESRRHRLPFAGHVPTLVSVAEASDSGMASIEHLQMLTSACSRDEDVLRAEVTAAVASPRGWDSAGVVQRGQVRRMLSTFDEGRCRAVADRLKRNGTWMVPTLTVLRSIAYLDDSTLASDRRLEFIPRFFSASWNPRNDFRFRMLTPQDWALRKEVFALQQRIARLLHERGVEFLAGTDLSNPYIYPGASLHEELRNLVAAGFSPLQSLQAATLNPARFLRATDSLGTVAPGRLADLVVLDADPLLDIGNVERVHAVVVNGRLVTNAERERLLEEGKRLARGGGSGGGGER